MIEEMTEAKIIQIFKDNEAFLEGHFHLSSGQHSEGYLQCAKVLQHPAIAQKLGQSLASYFIKKGISAVVSPAMGGLIIGHEVAKALDVPFLFTEREGVEAKMTFRRGFSLSTNKKGMTSRKRTTILVVEDVVTTGGSAQEVINFLQGLELKVSGVSSVMDRTGGKVPFSVPFKALASLNIKTYDPLGCPMCKKGLGVDKPGSRV